MDAHLSCHRAPRLSLDFPISMLERLAARYAEPHRHYHTWTHVLACLDARRRITEAGLPEVDLALLFHDAVYEPFAGNNETRSAELLIEEGRRAWLQEGLLQRACVLVQATQHHHADAVDSAEASIVRDADLSILGADRATFARYENEVRKEFAEVEASTYAAGRSAVLRGFLARPSIYATQRGRRLWEANARRNLEDSLARLGLL